MDDLVPRARSRIERVSLLTRKRALQTVKRMIHPADGKRTVILGGVQRSGTNMVLDVLERSAETEVFRESDQRAFEDYQLRSHEVLRNLVDASPAPTVVFKALLDLHAVYEMLDLFAPAKALWPVRNYADMVSSHLRKWSGCGTHLGRILASEDPADWRGRGLSEATRRLVSSYYRRGVNDATAVALFWYLRNALFFEQGFDRDDRVLALRYESLVSDPRDQFQIVFAFLGIGFSAELVDKVFASSVGKHPPPNIDPAVRKLCDSMLMRFDTMIAQRTG